MPRRYVPSQIAAERGTRYVSGGAIRDHAARDVPRGAGGLSGPIYRVLHGPRVPSLSAASFLTVTDSRTLLTEVFISTQPTFLR